VECRGKLDGKLKSRNRKGLNSDRLDSSLVENSCYNGCTVTSHISSDKHVMKKVTGSCSFVLNRLWWTKNVCNVAGRAT